MWHHSEAVEDAGIRAGNSSPPAAGSAAATVPAGSRTWWLLPAPPPASDAPDAPALPLPPSAAPAHAAHITVVCGGRPRGDITVFLQPGATCWVNAFILRSIERRPGNVSVACPCARLCRVHVGLAAAAAIPLQLLHLGVPLAQLLLQALRGFLPMRHAQLRTVAESMITGRVQAGQICMLPGRSQGMCRARSSCDTTCAVCLPACPGRGTITGLRKAGSSTVACSRPAAG